MQVLAKLPLLPLTQKQRGMIGEDRVRESLSAQLRARGVHEYPERSAAPRRVPFLTSTKHKDAGLSPCAWSSHAVEEIATATLKTGNHVCRPDVCHKGRVGRRGFCRMLFWHWARSVHPKKGPIATMAHGLALSKRWDGSGAPPLCTNPPFKGLPALEITHPFHFKMSPAILLGPKCDYLSVAPLMCVCPHVH